MLCELVYCVAALAGAWGAQPELTATGGCWEKPCLYRFVLNNDSGAAVDLAGIRLQATPAELPVLWINAEPWKVEPGAFSVVTAFTSEAVQPAEVSACISGAVAPIRAAAPVACAPYAVYVPATGEAHIFVRNISARDIQIRDAVFRGNHLGPTLPAVLAPGHSGVLKAMLDTSALPETGIFHGRVQLDAGESTSEVVCRFYSCDFARFYKGGMRPGVDCLHRWGTIEQGAGFLIARNQQAGDSVKTIAFCDTDVKTDTPLNYSQLGDICICEFPKPVFPESDSCHANDVFIKAEAIKQSAEPNLFVARFFAYMVNTGAPVPVGVSVLRNAFYACLAAGAKGIEVCTQESSAENAVDTGYRRLLQEVNTLQPLLAFSEPAPVVSPAQTDDFHVRALLASGKALLLFIIPRKKGADLAGVAATIVIDESATGMSLAPAALQIGGTGAILSGNRTGKGIEFSLQPRPDVQVFLVQAEQRP